MVQVPMWRREGAGVIVAGGQIRQNSQWTLSMLRGGEVGADKAIMRVGICDVAAPTICGGTRHGVYGLVVVVSSELLLFFLILAKMFYVGGKAKNFKKTQKKKLIIFFLPNASWCNKRCGEALYGCVARQVVGNRARVNIHVIWCAQCIKTSRNTIDWGLLEGGSRVVKTATCLTFSGDHDVF